MSDSTQFASSRYPHDTANPEDAVRPHTLTFEDALAMLRERMSMTDDDVKRRRSLVRDALKDQFEHNLGSMLRGGPVTQSAMRVASASAELYALEARADGIRQAIEELEARLRKAKQVVEARSESQVDRGSRK